MSLDERVAELEKKVAALERPSTVDVPGITVTAAVADAIRRALQARGTLGKEADGPHSLRIEGKQIFLDGFRIRRVVSYELKKKGFRMPPVLQLEVIVSSDLTMASGQVSDNVSSNFSQDVKGE